MLDLEAVGVDAADAEVYEALIHHPASTVSQLVEHLQRGDGQVRTALKTLVLLGLVSTSPGRALRYSPIPPGTALAALIRRQEEQLDQVRHTAGRLSHLYDHSMALQRASGLVEVVHGRDALTRISWELIAGARQQIRWFDRPPYPNDPPNALLGAEESAIKRGIHFRMLFAAEGVSLPGRIRELRHMAEIGQEMRVTMQLPVKLGIIDDRIAILPVVTPSHADDAAYLVHPSSLLDALMALFEDNWASSRPLALPRGDSDFRTGLPERAQPSEDESLLVSLLAAGLTDAAISRATGMGQRTVQRKVHLLMEAMGVTTRFQAGAAAYELGWLDPGTRRPVSVGQ